MPGRWLAAVAVALLVTGIARAGPLSVQEIRHAVDGNVNAAISLYREFLALPNDALEPDDIERLVAWLETAFGDRGFRTQRIPTDGNPALYAERRHDPASKTVLVYLQADGQPVDPSAWAQPDPFAPVLKAKDEQGNWQPVPWGAVAEGFDPDWRVFARSAADSKGPMTQFMVAVQLLDQLDAAPPYNLKVIVDTEEELGSPNLADAIRAHRDLFAARTGQL
jgi:acetylornithine deacetylase/succinyl-diaminopimelate desuccinylase-like protein